MKSINKKVKIKLILSKMIFLLIAIGLFALLFFDVFTDNIYIKYAGYVLLIFIMILIILNLCLVNLYYKNYKYQIKDDEICFKSGIFFKSYVVIPFCQLQDCGYSQGPIELMIGLAAINMSTAGSTHNIIGFTKEEAEEIVNNIKDKIKERVNALAEDHNEE